MPSLSVHLIGICGTGMGSFAGLLKASGHRVRGSDQHIYPPMSEKLAAWDIPVFRGYHPEHLEPAPDLVVIGNVVRAENPEARAVLERNLAYASFPDTLGRLFLEGKRSLVVTGTHGKTTTTSLLGWLLVHGGADPGLLVGGIPENLGESFRKGDGRRFVVEGDEYDTAFFDKRPKFLHYRPDVAVVTSLEYDHADIYPNVEAIEARFDEFVSLIPEDGRVLACADAPRVLARKARCRGDWQTYTAREGQEADWCARGLTVHQTGTAFELHRGTRLVGTLDLPMFGRYNVENAVAACAVALEEGLGFNDVREGLRAFRGVSRRQTVRAEIGDIRLIDDFAHHPTAVRETLQGLAERYTSGRVVAVFEPRSATSARRYFQEAYAQAFGAAAEVVLAPVGRGELAVDERLDVHQLADDIAANGPPARAFNDLQTLVNHLVQSVQPNDTVVFMSNGGFGGIQAHTEAALRRRHGIPGKEESPRRR